MVSGALRACDEVFKFTRDVYSLVILLKYDVVPVKWYMVPLQRNHSFKV